MSTFTNHSKHDSFDRAISSDLDECATGVAKCEQSCTNTLGSHICSCSHGYVLNSDGYHCDGTVVLIITSRMVTCTCLTDCCRC